MQLSSINKEIPFLSSYLKMLDGQQARYVSVHDRIFCHLMSFSSFLSWPEDAPFFKGRNVGLKWFPMKMYPYLWSLSLTTITFFDSRRLMWLPLNTWEEWRSFWYRFCHLEDVLHQQEDVCVLSSSAAGDQGWNCSDLGGRLRQR